MSFVSHLAGIGSGAVYPVEQPMNLCPVDNRPVAMVYDLERLVAERPGHAWYDPTRKDMWRFGGLLPLDIANAADRQWIVSGGEGATPMIDWVDHPLVDSAGIRLQYKEEGKAVPGFGANPTQSFKDRGMAVVVSMARRLGLNRLAVPTQGNAGDSLATYAIAAGLHVAVAMPDDTPLPILGRVAALARTDPRVVLELVSGSIREAGELLRDRYLPQGYFNVATFQEPGWRIEGKKTLGLEIAEPREPGGRWSLPDVIVYPTGGGTGVLGMWKAFDELECLGLIGQARPKMVCVQSSVTAPLVRAFGRGAADTEPLVPGHTLATGLNVPGGVGHFRVLEIIRQSGGAAVAIDEDDIASQLGRVWREKRWWISPEGAATVAALPRLLDLNLVRRGDRVVVVNTGSLEKYLPELRHLL